VLDKTRSAFEISVAAAEAAFPMPGAMILEATKWFAPGDRDLRHQAILDVVTTWEAASLLEVGCGAGDLYAKIRRRPGALRTYTGVDLSPAMIELARGRFPLVDFRTSDVLTWPRRPIADAVVAVGVFALLVERPAAHWLLMRRLIRRMVELSRVGIVFDFYDFFTDEEARDPAAYFAGELRRTDDTPIYCVDPRRVRRFAAGLGRTAVTRIHGVDGRVWRCVIRRD
jgi:SAM-dependent methyltransferase